MQPATQHPGQWYAPPQRWLTFILTSLLAGSLLAACASSAPTADTGASAATATTAQTSGTSDSSTVTETTTATDATSAAVAEVSKLNLNTTTEEEFLTVPNVGERMVREFFEYRPYVSIQQFRREIGKYVDEAQVAEYEQYVFVPVNPNEADEATLQQLPGVDATVTAELVAGRPYASNQAFLEKLAGLVSSEQAAAAEAYLVTE